MSGTGYYYEGVDPDALLDVMKSSYGYNKEDTTDNEEETGYSNNSITSYEDDSRGDLDAPPQPAADPLLDLHHDAYSQTANETAAAGIEQVLTGRYISGSVELHEKPDDKKEANTEPDIKIATLFDWNGKFQTAVGTKESAEKYKLLSSTARDFVYDNICGTDALLVKFREIFGPADLLAVSNFTLVFVATTYGRIIISEAPLPVEEKTIKPSSLGGIAGGMKYLVKGILFKFAVDSGNIYGGDENAQKAASSELKGLSSCYMAGVEGLHFPLMALIHYMGYCLIALSTLPLNANTLKYGSADAGKHVHDDDPELSELMKTLGGKLNLKGHYAGVMSFAAQKKFIYMPCDIEGHKGTDDRFYMVDFSRLFPPEAILPGTLPQQGALFFRHLRPELVINHDTPLSSDAFCGFGLVDPDRKTHNAEVLECTKKLLEVVIPNFAEKIKGLSNLNSLQKFKALYHSEGINIRHLGFLRTKLDRDPFADLVLTEMIARVLKNKLKNKWRKIVGKHQYITEDKCIDAATSILNLAICSQVEGEDSASYKKFRSFWNVKLKALLNKKFRFALSAAESSEEFDLYKHAAGRNNLERLVQRTLELTGITLSTQASANWTSTLSCNFQFLNCDIDTLSPIVKHTPIIEQADIAILFTRGLDAEGSEAHRLLSVAISKITQNYGTFLFPHEQLRTFGNLIGRKYLSNKDPHLYEFGHTCFTSSLQIKPKNGAVIKDYANFLTITGHAHAAYDELSKAVDLDPTDTVVINQLLKTHSILTPRVLSEIEKVAARYVLLSLAADPKQGLPYYYWAMAMMRYSEALTENNSPDIVKGQFNTERLDMLTDNIKNGFELDPDQVDILQKYFKSPRVDLIYALQKLPQFANRIDSHVKNLIFPSFVTNSFLEEFPGLTNLEILSITAPEVMDSGIISLINHSSQTLTKVTLDNTKIGLATLAALKNCPNLESLSLNDCPLEENPFEALSEIVKSTKLTQLFIKRVPHVTEQQIIPLITVRNMTRLGFAKTETITAQLFNSILDHAEQLSNMVRLDMESFDDFNYEHLTGLLNSLPYIKAINLENCTQSVESRIIRESMAFKHATLEELILPSGFPMHFTGSRATRFESHILKAQQIAKQVAEFEVRDDEKYKEFGFQMILRMGHTPTRQLEILRNNKLIITVDRALGDKLMFNFVGKYANTNVGELKSWNTNTIQLTLLNKLYTHQMHTAQAHFITFHDIYVNFTPVNINVLVPEKSNATLALLGAYVLGLKVKRVV